MLYVVGIVLVLLVLGVFVVRKIKSQVAQAEAVRKNMPADIRRTVMMPDYHFASIRRNMEQMRVEPVGEPWAEVMPGEPGYAEWKGDGYRVRYRFDPQCHLRAFEITGNGSDLFLNGMLNSLYMPSLEGYKLPDYLTSKKKEEILLGIFAARNIAIFGNQMFYKRYLKKLSKHKDGEIASLALKTLEEIQPHEGAPFLPLAVELPRVTSRDGSIRTGDELLTLCEDIKARWKREEKPVLFVVEDCFQLQDGVAVLGELQRGKAAVGDELELVGFGVQKKAILKRIEKPGEQLEEVQAGQVVSFVMDGLTKPEVLQGMVVASPGTQVDTKDFLADVFWLSVRDGGVNQPVTQEGLRAKFHIRNVEIKGRVFATTKDLHPGAVRNCHISLSQSMGIGKDTSIALRREGRTVGLALITETNVTAKENVATKGREERTLSPKKVVAVGGTRELRIEFEHAKEHGMATIPTAKLSFENRSKKSIVMANPRFGSASSAGGWKAEFRAPYPHDAVTLQPGEIFALRVDHKHWLASMITALDKEQCTLRFSVLYGASAESMEKEALVESTMTVVQPSFFHRLGLSELAENNTRKALWDGSKWAWENLEKMDEELALDYVGWVFSLSGEEKVEPGLASWVQKNPAFAIKLAERGGSVAKHIHRMQQIWLRQTPEEDQSWFSLLGQNEWKLQCHKYSDARYAAQDRWNRLVIEKQTLSLFKGEELVSSVPLQAEQIQELNQALKDSLLHFTRTRVSPVPGETSYFLELEAGDVQIQEGFPEGIWSGTVLAKTSSLLELWSV